MLVAIRGVDPDEAKWEEQMAQGTMGAQCHVDVLRTGAIKKRANEHTSCWMVMAPRGEMHFDEGLCGSSIGCVSKSDSAIKMRQPPWWDAGKSTNPVRWTLYCSYTNT